MTAFLPRHFKPPIHNQITDTSRQVIRLRDMGHQPMRRKALAHRSCTLALSRSHLSTVSKAWRLGLTFFLLWGTDVLHAQKFVDEWMIVSPPTGDSSALEKSNLPFWKLHTDGTRIAVSRWTRQDSEQSENTPLPEHLTRKQRMHGVPTVLHLDSGGWIVGFNWGEFEGGLWSTNQDGSETKTLLSRADVHALFLVRGGVIALTGVAHLTLDEGDAFLVPVSEWDTAKAIHVLDLHSSPEASAQDSADTALVATNKAILRIDATGAIETLLELPNGALFPRSVIVVDRTIYVGMRGYILRLLPQTTGYRAEWLRPPEGR
jgi:hypothetical protein